MYDNETMQKVCTCTLSVIPDQYQIQENKWPIKQSPFAEL